MLVNNQQLVVCIYVMSGLGMASWVSKWQSCIPQFSPHLNVQLVSALHVVVYIFEITISVFPYTYFPISQGIALTKNHWKKTSIIDIRPILEKGWVLLSIELVILLTVLLYWTKLFCIWELSLDVAKTRFKDFLLLYCEVIISETIYDCTFHLYRSEEMSQMKQNMLNYLL